MAHTPRVVLGLSVGTRYIGIAVFEGATLKSWREKAFHGPWSVHKLDKILKAVRTEIELYPPVALGLKCVHRSRISSGLERLIKAINSLAEQRKLPVYKYPVGTLIRTFVTNKPRPTRKDMARALASLYPILQMEAERELKSRIPYYMWLFEAVAAGLLCSKQIEVATIRQDAGRTGTLR